MTSWSHGCNLLGNLFKCLYFLALVVLSDAGAKAIKLLTIQKGAKGAVLIVHWHVVAFSIIACSSGC